MEFTNSQNYKLKIIGNKKESTEYPFSFFHRYFMILLEKKGNPFTNLAHHEGACRIQHRIQSLAMHSFIKY